MSLQEVCPTWLCHSGATVAADRTARKCTGVCDREFGAAAGTDGFVGRTKLLTLENRLAKQARKSPACMWPTDETIDKCWSLAIMASYLGQKDLTSADACAFARCRVLSSSTAVKCFAVVCE